MASSNNQLPPNNAARASVFDPRRDDVTTGVPCGPALVDSVGHSTMAQINGGVMCAMLFISGLAWLTTLQF